MNSKEYYELPYGVGDRMELQNFLTSDHYDGIAKQDARRPVNEPLGTVEILSSWNYQLTHNIGGKPQPAAQDER